MQYGWLLAFCSDSHTRIQPQPEHWLQPLAPQALLAYHQPAGTTQPAIGTYISVKLHTPERQLRLAIPVIMYGCHLAFTWHSRILTHLADIAAKPIAKRTLIAHNCKYIKARAAIHACKTVWTMCRLAVASRLCNRELVYCSSLPSACTELAANSKTHAAGTNPVSERVTGNAPAT